MDSVEDKIPFKKKSVEDKICLLLLYTCTVSLNHNPSRLFIPIPTPHRLLSLLPFTYHRSPITSSLPPSTRFLKKTRMIRTRRLVLPSLLFALLLGLNFTLSSATSAITAVLRDQVACTMCSSCDNPCQPLPSPPPPSSPPPSSEPNCPPPPSPPSSGNYYYSPPPPLPPSVPTVLYYSPPPPSSSGGGGGGGGEFYPPPSGNTFPAPPPPNPIVPYFPFYYYNPPPSAPIISKSLPVAKHSVVSSAIFLLIFQFFIF